MALLREIRAAAWRTVLICALGAQAGFASSFEESDIAGGVAVGSSSAEICAFDSTGDETEDSGGTGEAETFVESDIAGGVAVGSSPAEICAFDSTGDETDDSGGTGEAETFAESDIAGGVAVGSSPAEICAFDSTGDETGEAGGTGEAETFAESDIAGGVAAGSSPAELFLASGAYVVIGDGTNVTFRDSVLVTMSHSETTWGEIRYTLDGSEPDANSPVFERPFAVTTTTVVRAVAEIGGVVSEVTYTWLSPEPSAVIVDGVSAGLHEYGETMTVATSAEKGEGLTNCVCLGWVGTGDVPATGVGTQVTFTVTQPSSLTWLYRTNYWVAVDANVSFASGKDGSVRSDAFETNASTGANVSMCAGGSVVLKDAAGVAITNELWAAAGTNLTAAATPNEGWLFAGWRETDPWTRLSQSRQEGVKETLTDAIGTIASTCEFVVDAPIFLEAVFTQKVFTVTFDLGAHGARKGGGGLSQSVAYGAAAVAPEVTAQKNYLFDGWNAVFDCVTSNLTVTARYLSLMPYVSAQPADGCEAMGKVTGGNKNVKTGTTVTLKATANKGYVFAGWYSAGAIVQIASTCLSLAPSYTLTMPAEDVTLYAKFIAQVDDVAAVSFELPDEMANGVAIENAAVDTTGCTSLPTVKVTGLPTGLKFTTKLVTSKVTTGSGKGKVTTLVTNALPNAIYGTPTKSGVYTVVATVTTAGKKTASCSQTVVVRNSGENVVKAEVALIDAIGTIASTEAVPGKVTGMGVYQAGKKVTLKATANNGYVFAGWYPVDAIVSIASDKDGSTLSDAFETNASTCLSRLASYAFTMGDSDVALTAAFVTLDADKASIDLKVNGMEFYDRSGETPCLQAIETNVYVGAYVEWPVAASALSATTVKVSGLPTGLKFTATPVVTKTTATVGGKKVTTVVTNVPANTIYGTPTAASKADKKGVVQPSKVVVTVTTAGKNSQQFTINFTVLPLPTACVGTFAGYALVQVNMNATPTAEGETGWISLPCPFTATVDAKGGLSGSLTTLGKKLSFKATGYAEFDEDGSIVIYDVAIPLKSIDKTWTESLNLSIKIAPGEAMLASQYANSPHLVVTKIDALRNAAKDTGYAALAKPYAGTYVATFDTPMPDGVTTGLVTVALTVDAKGGVKTAGTFVDATTFSASATLAIAADGNSAEVLIPVTGKSFGSGGAVLAFGFAKGEDGTVAIVPLASETGAPVSFAAKYVPKTAKVVASYVAYDLLENAAYASRQNAWVGEALTTDDLLSVAYQDGETSVEAFYAFAVTKGAITGVGKTTNKAKLTFKLDAKTGLFTGANGKTKVFGALYPAVGEDATVSGLGSAALATGGVAPVAIVIFVNE